jgi:Tol biopolymer transport system component
MKSLVFFRYIVSFCVLPILITACDNGEDEPENRPPQSACGTPPAGTFTSPIPLTAVNSAGDDVSPEVTNGQLSLYFHSDRVGGYGGSDIYVSDRASQTDTWGTPINLGNDINTAFNERAATVSSDGLTLLFASDRDGDFDLYISTRNSVTDAWGPASNMGDTINSADLDSGPSLTEDGLTLVFFSDRPGGSGATDIYMSTRASTADAWSSPTNLGATVNSAAPEGAPDISCDGLRIYFHAISDIAMTERSSLTAPWSTPTIIPTPVSTADNEITPSISADETTLYFTSNRLGSDAQDIWKVTR